MKRKAVFFQGLRNHPQDANVTRTQRASSNNARVLRILLALFVSFQVSACSFGSISGPSLTDEIAKRPRTFDSERYLTEGTIIVSGSIPTSTRSQVVKNEESPSVGMAPLIGYFPTPLHYNPVADEAWLEIDRDSKKVSLFEGANLLLSTTAVGEISLPPGRHLLRLKQANPSWYANDQYFALRGKSIPPKGDRHRYLRGALGNHVLYPVIDFPIHSSPVWVRSVGGLRIEGKSLESIYSSLDLGSSIVIK